MKNETRIKGNYKIITDPANNDRLVAIRIPFQFIAMMSDQEYNKTKDVLHHAHKTLLDMPNAEEVSSILWYEDEATNDYVMSFRYSERPANMKVIQTEVKE
jgi:hypothetical protein